MKAIKNIIAISISIAALMAILYVYLVYKNNIDIQPIDNITINKSLNKSINWLKNNKDHLIKEDNPILWWFIYESAKVLGDENLIEIVNEYREKTLGLNSTWNLYFDKNSNNFTYFYGSLSSLPNYNKLFVYGLSCNKELGEEDFIQMQLQSDFCNWSPFYSSCSTHQLMGLRFIQRNNCIPGKSISDVSGAIASNIKNQLTWDPRVGDVYIQRALMLQESNSNHLIKPIWISNILNHQLEDGSWASFDPLISLGDSKYIGFSYKFIDIRKPESNFHTTSQAIYLLSLLATTN